MKVVVFSPHSAIWPHAFAEALVAEALQEQGHEVVYVTCGEQFQSVCVAMQSRHLTLDSPTKAKQAVCRECNARKDILKRNLGLRGLDLRDQLRPVDMERIAALLRTVTPADFSSLEADGLPIGRIAIYQLMIQLKRQTLDFTEAEMPRVRAELENTLAAYFGMRNVFEQVRPDRVITGNSVYSVNRVCWELARSRGISSYFVEASTNLADRFQRILLGRENICLFLDSCKAQWEHYRNVPCNREELANVTDHFLELMRARSPVAYSPPKAQESIDVRKRFQVLAAQRILLATLSSHDEVAAGEACGLLPSVRPCFPTQVAWLRSLIAFLHGRPDLFLIIRVHPREFPGARSAVKSDHARELEQVLVNLPANVRINWPSDQLSIFDLAEHTDVVLNAWSTAGRELALLGLPVLGYAPEMLNYPLELNYVATSEAAYYQQLETALAEGWSADRIRATYRWLAIEFVRSTIDISDGYPGGRQLPKALYRRIWSKLCRTVAPGWDESADCRRRSRPLRNGAVISQLLQSGEASPLDLPASAAAGVVSAAEEAAFLRNEVRRLVAGLYRGAPPRSRTGLRSRLEQYAFATASAAA